MHSVLYLFSHSHWCTHQCAKSSIQRTTRSFFALTSQCHPCLHLSSNNALTKVLKQSIIWPLVSFLHWHHNDTLVSTLFFSVAFITHRSTPSILPSAIFVAETFLLTFLRKVIIGAIAKWTGGTWPQTETLSPYGTLRCLYQTKDTSALFFWSSSACCRPQRSHSVMIEDAANQRIGEMRSTCCCE